jgi:hypothetical protein
MQQSRLKVHILVGIRMEATRFTEQKPYATVPAVLQELQPSPWRSLGRILDYSSWEDRTRFLELDSAISRGDGALRSKEFVSTRIVEVLY